MKLECFCSFHQGKIAYGLAFKILQDLQTPVAFQRQNQRLSKASLDWRESQE